MSRTNYVKEVCPERNLPSLHDELIKLNRNQIFNRFGSNCRVSKTIEQFTVSTLTQSALLRANALGHDIPPGLKVRFMVTSGLPKTRQTELFC